MASFCVRAIISFCKSTEISWVLENIYDIEAKRDNYKAKIISGENILVEKDLIEIIKVQWSNGTILSLTDNSYNLLKVCGINLLLKKNKKEWPYVIESNTIIDSRFKINKHINMYEISFNEIP